MNRLRDVHACAFVAYPYESVRAVLRDDPDGLLRRATRNATSYDVAVEVTGVTEDPPGQLEPCTRVALRWWPSHALDLSPMDATLDLMSLGPEEAQLDLFGRYRPRLGVVGAALDAVIGHRAMDAAVHRFIDALAERLRTEVTL